MKNIEIEGSVKFKLDHNHMIKLMYTNIDDVLDNYPDDMRDEMRAVLTDIAIFNLTDGETFLHDVRIGKINNDDALIDVIVDGYLSNLGLSESGFNQGRFLVDGDLFEDLCQDYNILVNWR